MKKLSPRVIIAAAVFFFSPGAIAQDASSSLLQLLLMGTGLHSNDWGTQTNTNMTKVESAIAGFTSVASTGGATMLTSDQARFASFKITGTLTSNATITFPSTARTFSVWNATTGAFTVTISCGGGTTVAVAQGAADKLICDGTNIVSSTPAATGFLPLSGGTLTGLLTLSGAPTVNLHAATKLYVDTANNATLAKTVTGTGSLTGGGAISTNPTIDVAAGGIGATQLGSNAVTTVKITDANVTPAKLSQPFTAMTATTASGAGVNFGSIPSWVKRITVLCMGTTFSVADTLQVQIGPSGGVETSSYTGFTANVIGDAGSALSSGFNANFSSTSAVFGRFTIEYVGSNVWMGAGHIATTAGTNISVVSGAKSLAGTLTQLTVKGAGGQSFSGGTIQVLYE